MASAVKREAPPGKLTQFQIFPRQTLRAIARSFDFMYFKEVIVTETERDHVIALHHRVDELLKDGYSIWPLVVKVDSKFWRTLQRFILIARGILAKMDNKDELEHFLKPLSDFYDTAEVDGKGLLVGPEVIKLTQSKGFRIQWLHNQSKKQKRRKKRVVKKMEYYDLKKLDGDEELKKEFEALRKAAEWKSSLFPPDSARTSSWLTHLDWVIRHTPITPFGVASINLKNIGKIDAAAMVEQERVESTLAEESFEEEKSVLYDDSSKILEISSTACESSPDSNETDAFLTPSETHCSAPTPIHHPATEAGAYDTSFKLNYFAVLDTPIRKAIFESGPNGVEGSERKVLVTTHKLLAWVMENGMLEKTALEDVIRLARSLTD